MSVQNPQQIYQQTQLLSPIDPNNSYFVIDMLDPVSKKYLTYKVTSTQLGALLQSMSKSCCTYTIKTTLSSAQILNLYTTPVILVPSPGSGLVIQPLDFVISYLFVTTDYDGPTSGFKIYNNGYTGGAYVQLNLPSYGADATTVTGSGTNSFAQFSFSSIVNQPLIVSNSANPVDGDGTLVIYTTFKVITV